MTSKPSEHNESADDSNEETGHPQMGLEDSSTEQASEDLGAFGRGLGRDVDSVAEEDEQDNSFRSSQANDRTDTYSIFPTIEGDEAPIDIPADELVPVGHDWSSASEIDTQEFVEAPSTPARGLAVPESEENADMTLSSETLHWLDAWAAREGTFIVQITSSKLQEPLKLLVVDGQLCFGMQIGKVPFLDVALKRRAPKLVARLVELYQNRPSSADRPLDSLIGEDELELGEHERNALMELMVRTLSRAAPFEDHAVRVDKVEAPDHVAPLAFSPLELVLAGRPQTDVAIGPLLERIPQVLQSRALQHWYFTENSGNHALDSLVASSVPGTCRLRDAFAAYDLGRRLVQAARQTEQNEHSSVSAIGMDRERCWFAASDGQFTLIYAFDQTALGLICSTARELSESREQVRASN